MSYWIPGTDHLWMGWWSREKNKSLLLFFFSQLSDSFIIFIILVQAFCPLLIGLFSYCSILKVSYIFRIIIPYQQRFTFHSLVFWTLWMVYCMHLFHWLKQITWPNLKLMGWRINSYMLGNTRWQVLQSIQGVAQRIEWLALPGRVRKSLRENTMVMPDFER